VPEPIVLEQVLDGGRVDAAVFALCPDYRAVLLAADGLVPGPSDEAGEELLRTAEAAARRVLDDRPVEQPPHVAAWREVYRAFGARPQRTRNSLEALLREDTTTALFVLDALHPVTDEALHAAAEDLAAHLERLGPDVRIARRLFTAGTTFDQGD